MANLYTSTTDVMKAVKDVFLDYRTDTNALVFPRIKTWNLGFMFPQTIYPAITVFPMSKTFLPMASDGTCTVEYRFSVDIFSATFKKLEDSKAFTINAGDDVKNVLKKSFQLCDKDGVQNAFSVGIENQTFYEAPDDRKRGLMSKASVQIVCRAFHEMNLDRVGADRSILETDFDTFLETIITELQADSAINKDGVRQWVLKTSAPLTQFPAVAILPGNEIVHEVLSNNRAILERPVQFHVITRGIPKWTAIKQNIQLADRLLNAIELYHRVSGQSQEYRTDVIDYQASEGGMVFSSMISSNYRSRTTLTPTYRNC